MGPLAKSKAPGRAKKGSRATQEATSPESASDPPTTPPVECVGSPFRIIYANPASSRSPSPEEPLPVRTKLLPDELGKSCEVRPKKTWDELGQYRSFVVSDQAFHEMDFIFVNHAGVAYEHKYYARAAPFWVARVLEIRALDSENVYIRVYWAYWPDELPGGRQPHQPFEELVLSNHMEIINAETVAGKANVQHWTEEDDENPVGLFWRQNFTVQDQRLSRIKEHCWCRAPYNPYKLLVCCDNEKCGLWLHEECILKDVLRRTYERVSAKEAVKEDVNAVGSERPRKKRKKASDKDPWSGILEATLNKGELDAPLRVIITRLRGDVKKVKSKKAAANGAPLTSWEESVRCLGCGETIE